MPKQFTFKQAFGYGPHIDGDKRLISPDAQLVKASGDQFFAYLRDSFDVLYTEGATAPRMMNVGLHCRLAGRPGRTAALTRFLDYVSGFDDVWICRRIDIARHWHTHHKPTG